MTLFQAFQDLLAGTSRFDLHRAIQTERVSNLETGERLHLLASSIRFIDIQDHIKDIAEKTGYVRNPLNVLREQLSPSLGYYDYALVDCPPNLGLITKNGLAISDFFLVPTVTDILSSYGVPQVVVRAQHFAKQQGRSLRCLGVVATKFQANSAAQRRGLVQLPGRIQAACRESGLKAPTLLETKIPQSNTLAEAMDSERVDSTFAGKYGYTTIQGRALYRTVRALAEEFITRVEG